VVRLATTNPTVPSLVQAFNACTPIGAADASRVASALADRLTSHLAAAAESAYPIRSSPVVRACKTLRAGRGAAAFRPLLVPAGACLDTGRERGRKRERERVCVCV